MTSFKPQPLSPVMFSWMCYQFWEVAGDEDVWVTPREYTLQPPAREMVAIPVELYMELIGESE